jgi:hypothetical protein
MEILTRRMSTTVYGIKQTTSNKIVSTDVDNCPFRYAESVLVVFVFWQYFLVTIVDFWLDVWSACVITMEGSNF